MQPLLIIGTQRSGSNMLRLMLNQMPEIAAPHPPHILQTFFPLLPKYGDLEVSGNFLQLACDICDFVYANPVPWEMNKPEPIQLVDLSVSKSLIGLYRAIYEMYALQHGAQIWCCKSMANLHFIPHLEREGLRPIYIHLVRDGRDVAASFRKTIVGEKHIYHLASQWKQDQEISESCCRQYAPERYILLRYEELIHDPERAMKQLLARLRLNFGSAVLDFYKSEEARQTANAGKMWKNVNQPVISSNSKKFLNSLSMDDISLFEGIAGGTLLHFGYKTLSNWTEYAHSLSADEIAAFDSLNNKMKDETRLTLDPLGSQKRKPQDSIIENIKAR